MPKTPTSGNFKVVALPKPETVPARCIAAIDVGTVDNSYKGEQKRDRMVLIIWELPTLTAVFDDEKGEQPFTIFTEMKFSSHKESNFAKLISAWRNKPLSAEEKQYFDYAKLIDKVGLISFQIKTKGAYKDQDIKVATNENSNLRLNGIGPVPKAMKESVPPMINEPVVWDWDKIIDGKEVFDQEKFGKIWRFIRKKMYTSDEWDKCPGAVNIDLEEDEQPAQAAQPAQSEPQAAPAPEETIGGEEDDW
jgi:hypothetical protein